MEETPRKQRPAPTPPAHAPARWVRKVLCWLLAVEGLIVALDVVFNYLAVIDDEGIQEMFNVARELSVGNWFSSMQEFAVATVLWLLYLRERDAGARGWSRRGWAVLAGLFAYIAVDDGVQIHERVATAVADFFTLTAEGGAIHSGPVGWLGRFVEWFPSYPWQVLFGPVFAAFGLFMVWFLWRELDRKSALTIFLGLFLYGLAQGQDYVEGLGTPYESLTAALSLEPYTVPHFAKVAEESLEMLGTTIVLYVLLLRWGRSDTADEVGAGAPL